MLHSLFRAAMAALVLCAGAHASDKGVTPTEIKLGASAVLSGPLGPQTADYGVGARLYFDALNAAGGVHGRKITYTTLDDGFDTKRAVENTRKLIDEEGVFIIFNNTGTAQTGAILPLLAESRTVAFGPVTGASAFREKVNPYLFHVRASYANEARALVSQLKRTGITKVAVFYQDDPLGKTLLAELKAASQAEDLPFSAEVKVDPNKPDFKAAADLALKDPPQAILMGTAGATFPNFVRAVHTAGAKPSFYGFSIASLDVINRELKEQSRGIVLAQIMPSLRNSSVPVVAEFLKLLKAKSPQAAPSASQFEGFVHARLLAVGLNRAGRNLTTESFIKAMESAGEISFGRFVATYSPQNHNGSSYVELAIIDNTGALRY